jgi:hypothetical protein
MTREERIAWARAFIRRAIADGDLAVTIEVGDTSDLTVEQMSAVNALIAEDEIDVEAWLKGRWAK